LDLLGGVDLRGAAEHQLAQQLLAQPKLVALVAHLAVAAPGGRFVRRDALIGLLWPELDQTHARTALRKAIHAVRAALGAEALASRGDEEIALSAGTLVCDVVRFREDVDAGLLARALERYRGDLMPGFHLSGCVEFGRWLDGERTELRERAGGAALALAQRLEGDAQHTVATRWARRAVRFAWDDERILRRALALLERAGDRAGALALYDDFARRLASELETEPSAETKTLVERMRRG
jgi:DNA-binding SARP family transcriptional activator